MWKGRKNWKGKEEKIGTIIPNLGPF